MGIINRMAIMVASRMSKEDKKKLMDEVVNKFFADLTPEEKLSLIDNWMDKFFADMTVEDKQKIVENTMPRIRDGFSTALIIPHILTSMMGLGQQSNNLPGMMPTMVSPNQLMPNVTTPGDCKPWEYCPCRKVCEENLKQNQGEDKE